MPKGEKIKAKAINGSATTWEILKNCRIELFVLSKLLHWLFCQKLVSCGKNVIMGKRGSFLKSLINLFWNDSLYTSTCVFDLEIEIWVWFAKTNQMVAKDDPYMPNLNKTQSQFLFEVILHFF
jgi:hypothetical protein